MLFIINLSLTKTKKNWRLMEIVLADSPVHVIAKRSIYLLLHPIIVVMVTFIIVALPFGCWI
jgi:hypothetical protein